MVALKYLNVKCNHSHSGCIFNLLAFFDDCGFYLNGERAQQYHNNKCNIIDYVQCLPAAVLTASTAAPA